jgi:uncharacterized cupredoxin-like copper-binding protein
MRTLTTFLTAICLLSIIVVVAVACGDDDSTGASKTVDNAQTAVVTRVQGAATAVVTNAQGAASAISGSVTAASGDQHEVNVTEKDFAIGLDNSSVSSGKVEFKIKNQGPSTHQIVVFKTDLAADKLPLNTAGTEVNETASGLTSVGKQGDIASGDSKTLEIDNLAPGKYVLICNVAGHYQLGMHTSLTVK